VVAGLGAKRVPKEPEKFQSYVTFAETASGKPSKLQAAKMHPGAAIEKKTRGRPKGSVSAGGGTSLSLAEALASATTAQIKAELARREGKSTGKRGRPSGAALHRTKPRGSS
jgi:hypothetical protein